MALELVEFSPSRPEDDISVAQFNVLRRHAVGIRQPTKPLSDEEEWTSFRSYHKNTKEYVASYDNIPIAVAARVKFTAQGRTADLLSIAVVPKLRSQSLGSQALSQIESICQDNKMRTLRVTALESAQGFYDKNDYQTIGRDNHLVLMKKVLTPSDSFESLAQSHY